MRFIKPVFCLILCAFLLCGCSFSYRGFNDFEVALDSIVPATLEGEMKTATFVPEDGIPADSFDIEKISFASSDDKSKIKIIPSKETKVELTYPSDIEDHGFAVEIRDGDIEISTQKNVVAKEFEAVIYANIDEIYVAGGVNLEVSAKDAREMDIEIDGAAHIYLYDLDTASLDIEINGAASLEAFGKTEAFGLEIRGAGSADAKELVCQRADIEISGAGSAKVSVEKELLADIDGVGSLKYYGDPNINNISDGLTNVEQESKEIYKN